MTAETPTGSVQTRPPDTSYIEAPTQAVLRAVNLLPQDEELAKASGPRSWFKGTPDSVAVIEAGVTAASKWWAIAISGGAAVVAARVSVAWDSIGQSQAWNQPFALLSVGVVLAAALGSVAFLLGSDVKGRAAATVATIEARRDVAIAMLHHAGQSFPPADHAAPVKGTRSGPAIGRQGAAARNGLDHGHVAENDVSAHTTHEANGKTPYILVKGAEAVRVEPKSVIFL
jgi:hypothetical protein